MTDFVISLDKDQIRKYADENVKALILKSFVSSGGEEPKFVQMHDFNFVDLKFMFEVKSSNN
jgi:glutathione synthase/RimK-type ligase-like ATP-grasp enzyme